MKTRNARWMGRTTLLAFTVAMALAAAPTTGSACDNDIRIAPETLNLRSNGTVVTVHTDILYSDMDAYSVFLNDVAIKLMESGQPRLLRGQVSDGRHQGD